METSTCISMNKITAIIQARVSSRRLPAKVLFKIYGKTILEHIIDRVNAAKTIDETIVATSINPRDLSIVRVCARKGVRVVCGSEEDVLDRFFHAARLVQTQHAVRITADCPLIDPALIDQAVTRHLSSGCDYTSNTLPPRTYPDGEDVEVVSYVALQKTWRMARLSSEREHVTSFIRNHTDIFTLKRILNSEDLSQKRWTLDEEADARFIRAVFKRLYHKKRLFSMRDILLLLQRQPELEFVNKHIIPAQGYAQSLKHDQTVKVAYLDEN
jgi:spore coat polysaccharide biosynthesis protein SpsF (cytidylyltransferase family)